MDDTWFHSHPWIDVMSADEMDKHIGKCVFIVNSVMMHPLPVILESHDPLSFTYHTTMEGGYRWFSKMDKLYFVGNHVSLYGDIQPLGLIVSVPLLAKTNNQTNNSVGKVLTQRELVRLISEFMHGPVAMYPARCQTRETKTNN